MHVLTFETPGPFDIRAVQFMGVSVKEKENAIGFFGTGLKYAIAGVLRYAGKIALITSGTRYEFTVRKELIRGKAFDLIYMNDAPLGISTELGKTWEPWMFMRELESNTRDENGRTYLGKPERMSTDNTYIIVECTEIVAAWGQKDLIFLSGEPLYAGQNVMIYPGTSKYCYYRGVRAAEFNKPTCYTYNITTGLDLTEDRTLKHGFLIDFHIKTELLSHVEDENILKTILLAQKGTFEHEITFAGTSSKAFLKVVGELGPRANLSARELWREATKKTAFTSTELSEFETNVVNRALVFLNKLGCSISITELNFSDDLGQGTLGCFHRKTGEIWIAKRAIEMGVKQTVSTIFEEHIHKTRGFDDLTYEMQNFLFDQIISMGERFITKEPL